MLRAALLLLPVSLVAFLGAAPAAIHAAAEHAGVEASASGAASAAILPAAAELSIDDELPERWLSAAPAPSTEARAACTQVRTISEGTAARAVGRAARSPRLSTGPPTATA